MGRLAQTLPESVTRFKRDHAKSLTINWRMGAGLGNTEIDTLPQLTRRVIGRQDQPCQIRQLSSPGWL